MKLKRKYVLLVCLGALPLLAFTAVAAMGLGLWQSQDVEESTLYETVRAATEPYLEVAKAEAAGYGLFHGCASGPEEGAMGIHYVKGDLVGDGVLDATQPEALMYEFRGGALHLVGVEYVVFADAWHTNHEVPPTLKGQLFNYVGTPNRYGIPAFYELHVWAWKRNPNGTFADWNPRVSCRDYTAEGGGAHH